MAVPLGAAPAGRGDGSRPSGAAHRSRPRRRLKVEPPRRRGLARRDGRGSANSGSHLLIILILILVMVSIAVGVLADRLYQRLVQAHGPGVVSLTAQPAGGSSHGWIVPERTSGL